MHTAILMYDASTNQSALPFCHPESDRVPICTCPADNAEVLVFNPYLYQYIYIQRKDNSPNYMQYHCILYDALTNQNALPLCLPESDRVPLRTCLADNARELALSLCIYINIYTYNKQQCSNLYTVYSMKCNGSRGLGMCQGHGKTFPECP